MTVELHIAGQMDGGWKFNGMANGEGTITVPVGYEITVEFTNDDSAMAHSLGVDAKVGGYGAMFDDPQPAFTGAITADPASMIEATLPAGEYAMVCYIPGHAVTGMWIRFNVSDGEPGVSM
jgi:FtsP/CotA-like multicopper oxidase with cupredoxin domain